MDDQISMLIDDKNNIIDDKTKMILDDNHIHHALYSQDNYLQSYSTSNNNSPILNKR